MRVLVLGAGVIGVCTAYWLLREGHEVEVVERREAAGLETSWGNGAIIHVSSVQPWAAPGAPAQIRRWIGQEDAPMLLRLGALPQMWRWGLAFMRNCAPARHRANALFNLALALESVRAMAEIRAATDVAYDYAGNNVVKTFATTAALDAAAAAHAELAPFGLLTERLDRQALILREPALAAVADRVAGALYFPQDELGDCNKFSQELAHWCAARGAVFHFATTVSRLRVERGRVRGALTSKGPIDADAVVAALGAAMPAILRPFGIRLPIYPVKGVSVTAPRAGWNDAPRMAVLDDARHFALVPIGDRLRAVGSAEITGFDATPDPIRIWAILARAYELFPGFRALAEGPDAIAWAGLRPMVPSGRPIIGPTAVPGLYVNGGHGHAGWTMAAGSGRRLAAALSRATDAKAEVAIAA